MPLSKGALEIITVAQAQTVLTAQTAEHDRAMRQSSSLVRGYGDASESAGQKSSAFAGLLKGVALGGVLAIGVGLAGAAGAGLGFNNSMQQVTAQLNAFTKDGAKSAQILEMIKDRASKTPFAFEEMAKAVAGLIPAARQAGVSLDSLTAQAEILAASNPAEGLEGAAFALREAVSGDFTSIIERFNLPRTYINQLKEEGVPALEIVRKSMLALGYDASLVANMSETLSGRWSTFLDTLKGVAAQATEPIFDFLSEQLAKVNQWFIDNQASVTKFGQDVAAAMGIAVEWVGRTLPPALETMGNIWRNNIAPALQFVVTIIQNNLVPAFQAVSTWVSQHGEAIRLFFGVALPAAFVLWAASATAAAIATLVALGPILPILLVLGAAVAAFALAWESNFGGIREITKAVISFVILEFGVFASRMFEIAKWINTNVFGFLITSMRIMAVALAATGDRAGSEAVTNIARGMANNQKHIDAQLNRTQSAMSALVERAAKLGWLAGDAFARNVAIAMGGVLAGAQAAGNSAVAAAQGAAKAISGAGGPITFPKMDLGSIGGAIPGVPGAGGGGGGAGSGAVAAIKDDAKEAEKAAEDFRDSMSKTLSFIQQGLTTLTALTNFVPPTRQAVESFFASLDSILPMISDRQQSWVGQFDEYRAKFAQQMGNTVQGVGQAIAPLKALVGFVGPARADVEAFFASLDTILPMIEERQQNWVGRFDEFRAKFAKSMSDTVQGVAGAIKPLAELKDFVPPARADIEEFFSSLDTILPLIEARQQNWVNRFDEFRAKFADHMGNTVASVGKAVGVLSSLVDFTAPTDDAVIVFFDALDLFLRRFDMHAAAFQERAGAVAAELGERIGKIAGGIGKALEPLFKMAEAQKVDPGAIEGALANVWLALHHFNEVMKSGELQGDWVERASMFATAVNEVFTAVATGMKTLLDVGIATDIAPAFRELGLATTEYVDGPLQRLHAQMDREAAGSFAAVWVANWNRDSADSFTKLYNTSLHDMALATDLWQETVIRYIKGVMDQWDALIDKMASVPGAPGGSSGGGGQPGSVPPGGPAGSQYIPPTGTNAAGTTMNNPVFFNGTKVEDPDIQRTLIKMAAFTDARNGGAS